MHMKLYLLFLCLPFLSQTTWEEFVSLDGRFKVLVPGQMTEQVDSVETEVGTLAYHVFLFQNKNEAEAENLIYMVTYCDYPAGIIFADSIGLTDDFFHETMAAAAETVEGEIIYSADIQINDHPGKQWRIDYLDGGAIIKTKAFLVKNRYYSIQVVTTKERNLNSPANQFLDSFRLL